MTDKALDFKVSSNECWHEKQLSTPIGSGNSRLVFYFAILKGKSGGKDYELSIEFFKEVDTESEDSKYKVQPRSVHFFVKKKSDDQEEFWPRLLKDKAKEKNQVQVDWDRYVDEDEEDEAGGFDMGGLEG